MRNKREVKFSHKSGPILWNPGWEGQHQPAQEQTAEPEQAVNGSSGTRGQADDEQVRQLEWAAILVEQGKLESA